MISTPFLIIALILVSAIIILGVFLYRFHRYLIRLTDTLNQHLESNKTVDFGKMPASFKPLTQALVKLEQSTPFNVEKDKLTGLCNRVGFKRKMLNRMPVTSGMLVLIDIKQFRFVNDLFGFDFGDELLKAFSLRIEKLPIKAQFVARMNGNEFLLFFDEPLNQGVLSSMKAQLQAGYLIEQQPINVKVQMGVLVLAQHHADVSVMLRRLDLALKKAKQNHQDIAYYSVDDDKKQYRELLILNSLAKSLQQHELHVLYQPKLAIQSGECHELEALLRWEHAGLGVISPNEFIPLAEQTGMIHLVTDWVVNEVIKQQAKWRESGLVVKVAINVSSSDLERESFISHLEQTLSLYQMPADCLMVEITESAVMESLEDTVRTVKLLKAAGIKVAIDDFGTGHSSLAYLRDLPVDEVKIDKAFLTNFDTDIASQKIIKMTIALAKELGFAVTVEGVECLAILEAMANYGADKIQGELFAQPLTEQALSSVYPSLTEKFSNLQRAI